MVKNNQNIVVIIFFIKYKLIIVYNYIGLKTIERA